MIEHGRKSQGLGLDVGELTKANFDRLGMTRTSLMFQNGQDPNVADGWNSKGLPEPHDKRSKVRAAGGRFLLADPKEAFVVETAGHHWAYLNAGRRGLSATSG